MWSLFNYSRKKVKIIGGNDMSEEKFWNSISRLSFTKENGKGKIITFNN